MERFMDWLVSCGFGVYLLGMILVVMPAILLFFGSIALIFVTIATTAGIWAVFVIWAVLAATTWMAFMKDTKDE